MRLCLTALSACLVACSSGSAVAPMPAALPDPTPAVLALSDSVLAAAGDRNAARFAGYFSDRPGFRYLINTRQLDSRETLRTTFEAMLRRQQVFRPTWHERSVQVVSPQVAILTGTFSTEARKADGDAWTARGVVTFVAVRERETWRVAHWHTSE